MLTKPTSFFLKLYDFFKTNVAELFQPVDHFIYVSQRYVQPHIGKELEFLFQDGTIVLFYHFHNLIDIAVAKMKHIRDLHLPLNHRNCLKYKGRNCFISVYKARNAEQGSSKITDHNYRGIGKLPAVYLP